MNVYEGIMQELGEVLDHVQDKSKLQKTDTGTEPPREQGAEEIQNSQKDIANRF